MKYPLFLKWKFATRSPTKYTQYGMGRTERAVRHHILPIQNTCIWLKPLIF